MLSNSLGSAPAIAGELPSLHLLSARDIASQLTCGALRAVDLIEHLLVSPDSIRSCAMVDVDAAYALTQAAAVGRPSRAATYSSALFAEHIAPRDSWSVARLKAHGAICLGITNCSEFACKDVTIPCVARRSIHGVTI